MDNNSKPTLQPQGASFNSDGFWTKPKKILAFVIAAFVVIALLRACGNKPHQEASYAASKPLPSAEDIRQVNDLQKQLEAQQQALRNQAQTIAPSAEGLSTSQQRAIGDQPRPAAAPQKQEARETTTMISFRDDTRKVGTEKESQLDPAPPVQAETGDSEKENQEARDTALGLNAATGPKYRIRAGTLLPCTQMIRVNGALPSHINCLISFPIFATSGNHLLIPAGTLALGKVEKVASQNQERLYVSFQTLVMADGYTFREKDAADGLDQIGQTGLRDKVNHHYGQIFGAGLAIAAVGGLAEIGNTAGSYSASSQYRVGFTEQMSQNAMQVLQRFASVLPTFIIREGSRNNLYLPGDIYLPDYANHAMKGNM